MFTARRFILLIIVVLFMVLIFGALIYHSLGRKRMMKLVIPQPVPGPDEFPQDLPGNTARLIENKTMELPEDLRELYDLILKKDGRTTQKEVRKDAKYGEAKVSLMLADLEKRGLVKKIKKGRSNIIIAENIK